MLYRLDDDARPTPYPHRQHRRRPAAGNARRADVPRHFRRRKFDPGHGDVRATAFSPAVVHAELAYEANTFLLAFIGDAKQPAGYAKLRTGTTNQGVTGPDPVELQRLYVDRHAIGHGIGAALMQACIDAARSAGQRTLRLGVWEHNLRAISFYQRWGFETVGEHVFRLGSDDQRDLIMVRPVLLPHDCPVPAGAAPATAES